jgi:hypothetical protein
MRPISDGRREAGGLRDVAEQRDLEVNLRTSREMNDAAIDRVTASADASDLHPLATGRGMNAAIVCWTRTSACNRLAASGEIWLCIDANGD